MNITKHNRRAKHTLKYSLSVAAICAVISSPASAQKTSGNMDEVIVTGSYVRGTAGDSVLPVQVVGRNDIDNIGANNVADIITKLAINTGSENQGDAFTQNATQGTSNINLRGLGLSSTLVLINGRRQTISGALPNDGSVFVDTSTITVDSIQRIEVLKEGAASTYGSDAIAGVVNFILRKDFEGLELNAGISVVEDGGQRDLDLGFLWGVGNERTNLTVSGHYLDRTALNGSERLDLVDNAVSSLGATFLPFAAAPVTVATGPYAGTYAPFENVPLENCEGTEGGVLIAQPSGSRCGFAFGSRFNLVNEEERAQIYSNLSHSYDNGVELFAELGYSSAKVKDNPQSPTFPDLTFPFIGATHPGNPFGVGVIFLGRPLGAGTPSPLAPRESETFRASLNLTGDIGDSWEWDTALTYSQNEYTLHTPDTLKSRFRASLLGLGGPNNNEFFDPFNPANNSAAVIEDFSYLTEIGRKADLLAFDGVVSGKAFELPAGPVGVAAGVQFRAESFAVNPDEVSKIQYDATGNRIPVDLIYLGGHSEIDVSRETYAAFVEAKLPLFENLELTTALRYEELQKSSSFDPKVALRWQVADSIALRGSFSTAFREPSLPQQNASAVSLNGIQDFNADGTPKGGISFIRVAATGTPSLKSEQSKNYNLGLIYEPTSDLSFKLDYWRVDYKDLIAVENAQGKISSDINGPDIIRDPLGNLVGINVDYFNSSDVDVQGLDFDASLAVSDEWNLGLNVSHFLKYDVTLPNGTEFNAAGFFNNNNFVRSVPETKANLNAGWQRGRHKAFANVNYISGYDQNQAVPAGESDTIDSYVTVDGQYGIGFGETKDGNHKFGLTFGVKNLFDQGPPRVFDGTNFSYDPKQHSPLGRTFYAKAKARF